MAEAGPVAGGDVVAEVGLDFLHAEARRQGAEGEADFHAEAAREPAIRKGGIQHGTADGPLAG